MTCNDPLYNIPGGYECPNYDRVGFPTHRKKVHEDPDIDNEDNSWKENIVGYLREIADLLEKNWVNK